jgi:hypothetical protein
MSLGDHSTNFPRGVPGRHGDAIDLQRGAVFYLMSSMTPSEPSLYATPTGGLEGASRSQARSGSKSRVGCATANA